MIHPKSVVAQNSKDDKVIYLNQGWSQADRDTYYWIPQGTVMMSFDIFQNLELAGSQELFRSDANSRRYGLIPSSPDAGGNPDGLPIGITKQVTTDGRWKGVEAGINCAACHNSELHYKGKRIRIDGDSAVHFDVQAFFHCADDAMQATLHDSAKFDRLAAKIGASSGDAKTELRQRFEREAQRTHYYTNTIMATTHPWGPGRVDALNLILNRKFTIAPDIPQNWFPPLAPTKPPFVWNAPQGSWTQWSAIQQDPVVRNFGETQGVYMPMDLTSKTPEEGLFESNARLLNLGKIEDLLDRLAPSPVARRDLWKASTAPKRRRARSCSPATARGATIHIPIPGPRPTSTASAFSKLELCSQSYVGTGSDAVRGFQNLSSLLPS